MTFRTVKTYGSQVVSPAAAQEGEKVRAGGKEDEGRRGL